MTKRTVKIRNTEIGSGLPKICVPLVAADLEELAKALQVLAKEESDWQDSLSAKDEDSEPENGGENIGRDPQGEERKLTKSTRCSASGGEKSFLYDLVEWRVDFFKDILDAAKREEALRLIRLTIGERPLLFTYRTQAEGGNGFLPAEEYFTLLQETAGNGLVDLVDIEVGRGESKAQELAESLHDRSVYALGSYHDFAKTPPKEEITDRLVRMQELGMDITKMAVMPGTREDVLKLMQAALLMDTVYGDRPCVTMSMGPLGVLSRFAGTLTGSAITFGTAGKASAPGQPGARDLRYFLPLIAG